MADGTAALRPAPRIGPTCLRPSQLAPLRRPQMQPQIQGVHHIWVCITPLITTYLECHGKTYQNNSSIEI
uniref:Uncharacterized protein n=1 Tax=Oryza nivara TaxID=4536 RepID=A0A0E0IR15_ORYNI